MYIILKYGKKNSFKYVYNIKVKYDIQQYYNIHPFVIAR